MHKTYDKLIVILDPGHAVTTPGKRSPIKEDGTRFYEYQSNREIADLLADMLRSYGITVFFTTDSTRDGDKDVSLTERAKRANDYIKNSGKKGIFVSIHSNAFGDGKSFNDAKGWCCYTTKGQNNSDKLADSLYYYAEQIFPDAGKNVKHQYGDGDPDYEENFTVIYKSNYPAILTESFFYTNKQDLEYLESDAGKLDIVNVHLFGILKFAEDFYKM